MILKSKIYRLSLGHNVAALTNNEGEIEVYYFDGKMRKKIIETANDVPSIKPTTCEFNYTSICPVTGGFYVANLNNSVSIKTTNL